VVIDVKVLVSREIEHARWLMDAAPRGLFRSAAPEVTAAGEPPLVGREPDLARLDERLESALSGHGRRLVMIGEAGIGKSRLVAELLATAMQRQGRVLIGRCYETERILPFAPWVDALRAGQVLEERDLLDTLAPGWRAELARLLPELRSQGEPAVFASDREPGGRGGDDARHLFEAITELLKRLARRQPLVVVLEDLHWADEMSVRLLAFFGRRLRALPVLALATVREEELADSAFLRQTLDELDGGGELERVPVAPLSRVDTTALVRVLASPGIPDTMISTLAQEAWSASDGNAFVCRTSSSTPAAASCSVKSAARWTSGKSNRRPITAAAATRRLPRSGRRSSRRRTRVRTLAGRGRPWPPGTGAPSRSACITSTNSGGAQRRCGARRSRGVLDRAWPRGAQPLLDRCALD
jgi:AAA ATPase domain